MDYRACVVWYQTCSLHYALNVVNQAMVISHRNGKLVNHEAVEIVDRMPMYSGILSVPQLTPEQQTELCKFLMPLAVQRLWEIMGVRYEG
mgnify:CR=1 FL=1